LPHPGELAVLAVFLIYLIGIIAGISYFAVIGLIHH
jgi:hypothetical protein